MYYYAHIHGHRDYVTRTSESLSELIEYARHWLRVDYEAEGKGFSSLSLQVIGLSTYDLYVDRAYHGHIERF